MSEIYFNHLFYKRQNSSRQHERVYRPRDAEPFDFVPQRSKFQEWTYIRSDIFVHRPGLKMKPFALYLEEVAQVHIIEINSELRSLSPLSWVNFCVS